MHKYMENQINVESQNIQQIGQNPSDYTSNSSNLKKSPSLPIWQTDAFIILTLIIFWPIGIFLMWKYVSWRKWIKTLITLFFGATIIVPIILFFFFSVLFSNQIQKRSSFGTPLPSTASNTQTVQSKVYNFENLGNGYMRVTSQKYKFSFDFASNLKYHPPFGEEQPGVLESIGFQTEKRQKNDSSASYVINFAPSTSGTPCESYKTLSNWSVTTLNGLPAVKSTSTTSPTIIACSGIYNYTFSYFGLYTPNKEGMLTPEDIATEKEVYDHILQTFKILQ